MIKKLLFTLLIVLLHTVVFAQKTYNATSGNWNVAANWTPNGVPTSTDDVIIPSGKTVIINVNAEAKSISVIGKLTLDTTLKLVVYGNFEVVAATTGPPSVPAGNFKIVENGNSSTTLIVLGNYINNGTTDFDKGDVIIVGDLTTPSTSTLQNLGNVIVGGNIIGDFNLQGSIQANQQIYAVNPNATVIITPTSIDADVVPGTQVTTTKETDALVTLVNQYVYGGSCPFIITDIANISVCSGSNAIFTVTTNGSSPSYLWQVNTNGSGWVDLTNSTTYSGVTSSTLTITGVAIGMNNYKYRAKITGGSPSCTKNGNYGVLTVNTPPVITTQPVNQLDCEGSYVTFKAQATGTGTLTYTWQRKRPSDAGFAAIPSETNVTYPTPGEIKLENVGSSLSPNGTQYQVVVSNGTCNVTSIAAQLAVNEITDITSPPLTPSQSIVDVTLCYGTNYSYNVAISNPSNGPVSYQWKSQAASGSWNNVVDGPHFSGSTTATLNIINGTPAESAKYRVDVVYTRTGGNCSVSSFSKIRLLTFLPLLTTPATAITQPTCSTSTGVINVTVQSLTDTYSFDNGANYQASNVKSGLIAGTYNVIIKNIKNCISSVTNCVITAPVVSTWNGSIWSPSAPTSIDKIIFNGSYLSSGDITGCSCQVNSGAVVIKSGHTLSLANELTVSGGSLKFENNASLIQTNTVTTSNTGNITYERLTPTIIDNFDYTYWSSPVSPQKLIDVSPNTSLDKFYSFNLTVNDWQQENPNINMTPGVGYIIRGPQTYAAPAPPSLYQASFKGVPNNGVFSVVIPSTPIGSEASALLGNPYPSAIDADLFLKANMATALEGTLYFWTHNTNIGVGTTNLGSGAYAYTSDDYATYNLTGGAATAAAGVNNSIPNGKIASGQAFFAGVNPVGGTVTFNNNMRLSSTGTVLDNSQFFKLSDAKSKASSSIEKDRVWLNLFNSQGAFKQTLVGYITGATDEYDNGYDGETFDGNEFVDFYSINQDKNLVIQGRALPFDETDEVPLGYKTTVAGDFTIAIAQTDGFLATQEIFLEDKINKSIRNLKVGHYTFTTGSGTFNDRFVLRFINANKTLGTSNFDELNNTVFVSNKNKQIKINSSVEMIDKVQIYDLLGRSIYQKMNVNTSEFLISNLVSNHEVLLIKIKLQNGQTVTKKIVY